jgi:hypothetical protein
MIVIVTDILLKAAQAATPTVGPVVGERVEHRPTTRMISNRRGGHAVCGVSREFA